MENITANFPDISFIDNATIEEVLTQMINDYQEKYKELTKKEVSLAQSDPYRLIMYACTIQIYQAMQYADYAGKMSFLKYARGEYLDNLAALRGISRFESTSATTMVQFSIDTMIEAVVPIPAGTRVTNGNDIYFATDDYAEIPAGETSVIVSATCTTSGTAGNGFAVGEINVLVNTLPYIQSVKNMEITSGGKNVETDESLKDRIFNVSGTYATTGTEASYIYHVKQADPTIIDVNVQSSKPGIVDIYFVCEEGVVPSELQIKKVAEYLNSNDIRPLTDKVVVHAPKIFEYNVEFTYYISSSDKAAVSKIQKDIETAVTLYNAWQVEKIGRDINPSNLIQRVMSAGAKRVEVTSPSFSKLDKGTIASIRTVNVVYGGLEDD